MLSSFSFAFISTFFLVCFQAALSDVSGPVVWLTNNINVQVSTDDAAGTVTFAMTGPIGVWWAVGFGSAEMEGTYAIIAMDDDVTVEEYILGFHARGQPCDAPGPDLAISNTVSGILRSVVVTRGMISACTGGFSVGSKPTDFHIFGGYGAPGGTFAADSTMGAHSSAGSLYSLLANVDIDSNGDASNDGNAIVIPMAVARTPAPSRRRKRNPRKSRTPRPSRRRSAAIIPLDENPTDEIKRETEHESDDSLIVLSLGVHPSDMWMSAQVMVIIFAFLALGVIAWYCHRSEKKHKSKPVAKLEEVEEKKPLLAV